MILCAVLLYIRLFYNILIMSIANYSVVCVCVCVCVSLYTIHLMTFSAFVINFHYI